MTWHWALPAHVPTGAFVRVRVDGGALLQNGAALSWDGRGYYEVALDPGELTWIP